LGLSCAAGVAVAKAHPLLEGAVRSLLAQQTPGGFPAGTEKEQADQPARLAWCYGDPGVAAALLRAARLVNEPAWERESSGAAGGPGPVPDFRVVVAGEGRVRPRLGLFVCFFLA